MKIYQYTTFDSFFRIWISEHLLLNEYKNMNDLFERQKFCAIEIGPNNSIPKGVIHEEGDPLEYVFERISEFRQVSFCQDYKNGLKGCMSSMMWGQYAKNNHGVCIEFDLEKLLSGKTGYIAGSVNYVDKVPYISINASEFHNNYKDNIRSVIIRNKDTIFFTKHSHWTHENEFRIVSDTKKNISIKNAVTCIYVQDPHNPDVELLKRLVQDTVPVKYISLVENANYVNLKINEL